MYAFLWFPSVGGGSSTTRERLQLLSPFKCWVDSRVKPTYFEVSIKASKTDVFRKGVTVVLGATGKKLCPVATILQFMSNPRPAAASPRGSFFVFSDGSALTRAKVVKEMRAALEARGIRPSDYAGHSFRIGTATTAATCGMPDFLIKTLRARLHPIHKDTL